MSLFPILPSAAISSVSLFAFSTSSSESITLPANILDGDLVILYDLAENIVGAPSTVVPAGFTSLVNTTVLSRAIVSYKIAVSTDSSSSKTGMNGSGTNSKLAIILRFNERVLGVTAGGTAGEQAGSDPSAQVVPSGSAVSPLLVVAAYGIGGGATVSPRTMTPAKDGEQNYAGSKDLWLAWKLLFASPVDVTVDMDDEGVDNTLQSGYLSLI
jgi:hypothetical protein